jgi:hypothetical protein
MGTTYSNFQNYITGVQLQGHTTNFRLLVVCWRHATIIFVTSGMLLHVTSKKYKWRHNSGVTQTRY